MKLLIVPSFTNLGYRFHARKFKPIASNLDGKVVLVTGATGGLGLATVRGLASLGVTPLLVGRNKDTLNRLQHEIAGARVYQADLSNLAQVRALATSIVENEPRIDVLINNVGILFREHTVTDEGLEATFATNLAGQFLLTNLLYPLLEQSAPARVVTISSGGMYTTRLDPEQLQPGPDGYKGASAYAQTKRAQVVLTEEWARVHADSGVVFHAMHPGWAKTKGVETSLPGFNRLMRPLLRTPEQGADTTIWLAADTEPGISSGRFWFDRAPAPTHLIGSTVESAEDRSQLVAYLETITQV